MTKPKVPDAKGETTGKNKSSGQGAEKEPERMEESAKKIKNFTTIESRDIKGKKSVPNDSTAQRGKTPVSTSEEEKKKHDSK